MLHCVKVCTRYLCRQRGSYGQAPDNTMPKVYSYFEMFEMLGGMQKHRLNCKVYSKVLCILSRQHTPTWCAGNEADCPEEMSQISGFLLEKGLVEISTVCNLPLSVERQMAGVTFASQPTEQGWR